MYTAEQIADWFLGYNKLQSVDFGAEDISNLKLQKLLYYAQGTVLALTDKPLFNDPIVAWKHGPVVEKVYQKFKNNGACGIELSDNFEPVIIDLAIEPILKEVYDVFGQYSAWKLREMTHEETPWKTTPQSFEISSSAIKDYFKKEYIED